MKQLLPLFLLLFPYLALAQYQGNGNQKITLGEQTSADGLVYRGLAADTTRKPSVDTMAYILLDTNTNIIWQYKKATNNAWTRVGGSISSGVTGVLPVANGGTGATSFSPNNYLIKTNSSGIFDTSAIYEAGGKVSIGKNNPAATLEVARGSIGEYLRVGGDNASNTRGLTFTSSTTVSTGDTHTFSALSTNGVIAISTNFLERFRVASTGEVTINNLQGSGNRTVIASATGVLSAPVSSINTKENVQILNYGLNEILQINPVSFDYIDKDKWGEDRKLGFIVEDIYPIVPEVTGTMNNGDLYLDMVKLIPILTKAIQEQNALIKALEQRLLILENK
jgi:hypothetical protein